MLKKAIKRDKGNFQNTKRIYKENRDEIANANLNFYINFNWIMLICLVILYISTFVSDYAVSLKPIYLIFIASTCIEIFLSYFIKKRKSTYIMPLCYFGIAKAYTFCLFSSVIYNVDSPTITYYVFMFIIPVAFLLQNYVLVFIQVFSTVVFCLSVVIFKEQNYIVNDIFNAVFFLCISLFISQLVGKIRFNNIEIKRIAEEHSKEIENNRNLLQSVVKDSNISIWEYDVRTRELTLKNSLSQRTGLENLYNNAPESIIDSGFIHKDSVDTFKKLFNDAINGVTRSEAEIQFYTKDKLNFWWAKLSLFWADGEKGKYIGTAIDITDEKSYEYFYKEQMRIVSNENDDVFLEKACWNLNTNKREMRVMSGASSLLYDDDITCDDARKILVNSITNEKEKNEVNNIMIRENLIDEFRKGNAEYNIEYQRRTNTNDVIWVNTRIRVCLTPNNDIVGFVFSKDITSEVIDRKIINQFLYNDYEFFGTIVVRTKQSIVRNVKPQLKGVIEELGVYKKATDYDKSIVKSIENFIILEENETLDSVKEKLNLDYVVSCLEKENTYIFTFSVKENDSMTRKQLKFAYLDSSKEVILFYRTDITKLHKIEQKRLKKVEELLVIAEKANAAKSEFLSRMSHDMRTPMNGVLGMTQLTLDIENIPSEVRKNLLAIEDSSKFLLSLINDTLDMSRIESQKIELNLEVVQSKEFVDNIITSIKSLAKTKNINIKFVPINLSMGYIKIDQVRVKQIFINILSNAVKFTSENGEIVVEIEQLKTTDNIAYTKILVADNGIGISKEFLSHLYEPFAQENENTPSGLVGTGLGLSIVKSLVELMGGSINIESEKGKGTKVTVLLNIELAPECEKSSNDSLKSLESIEHELKGKRILLVEDHPLNAIIATRLLQKIEIEVEHVENGKIAVDKFSSNEVGYYDAVLMDIRMPVMDGFESTREIRNLDREDAKIIPIIALSANAFDEDVEKSLQSGMNAHLAKPIEPGVMYDTLYKQIMKK